MLNKLRLARRFKNFMALTISLLFLLTATPSIAADTQTIPWTHLDFNVCSPWLYASIENNIIAFSAFEMSEDLNGDGKISTIIGYRNIDTNKTTILPFEGFNPSISDGKIAFRESRRTWGSPSKIKIYDIKSRKVFDTGIYDYSIKAYGEYGQRYYSHGTLIYVDENYILKYIDFNTGAQGTTSLQIDPVSRGAYQNYTIDSGKITLSNNGTHLPTQYSGDIYYFDIANNVAKIVGSGVDAQAFKDKIVWTENYNDETDIAKVKLYDTLTQEIKSFDISLTTYWTYWSSGGFILEDNNLIYLTSYTGTISILDIETGKIQEFRLDGFPEGLCCIIAVSGNIVVFDVYGYDDDGNYYNCELGYADISSKSLGGNIVKNHGQYVSSIAKSTESGPDKGSTVREAARSMVGMPECSNKK